MEYQRSIFNYLKKAKQKFTSSFIEACYLTLTFLKGRSFKTSFKHSSLLYFIHMYQKSITSIIKKKRQR